jgi:hypothetical protein
MAIIAGISVAEVMQDAQLAAAKQQQGKATKETALPGALVSFPAMERDPLPSPTSRVDR